MDILYDDGWIEIMKHLDFDLHVFISTCHYFNQLFIKHKKLLCDEEHYQFSPFQKRVYHDLMNHCNDKLVYQPYHHPGMKAVLLAVAFKLSLLKPVIIFTKKDTTDWYNEVFKLYKNNSQKSNAVLILNHASIHIQQLARKYQYNPYKFGYKVLIMQANHFTHQLYQHDYWFINYKSKIYNPLHHITLLSADDLHHTIDIHYKDVTKTIFFENHLECYRNDTAYDIYLDPHKPSILSQSERLSILLKNILAKNTGPYLIIDDHLEQNANHLFLINKNIKQQQICMCYNKQLLKNKNMLKFIKTVIYLWPGHDVKFFKIKNLMTYSGHKKLNIYYIHSTIEEAFLLKTNNNDHEHDHLNVKLLQTPRKKLEFLEQIRKMLTMYSFDQLYYMSDDYFYLLLHVQKCDLEKVEHFIDDNIL
ncbi:MAG TPA: hypothetical protein VLG50_05715 [Candidatus Saccharimonadales bacterium]|nr:hypothetical protein [Candidatus Saccharimonadales bacterium]